MTINVTGINQPPTVSVTAPVDGASFTTPATVALAASASDVGGSIVKVEFFTGTTSLGSVTAAPWTRTWANVGAGTYAIVAKATDNLGATRTSAPVTVTVTSVAASVALFAPVGGAKFPRGQPIAITAQASSPGRTIARIEFLSDGVVLGATNFVQQSSSASSTFAWAVRRRVHTR
jgi:hypothetical protein